MQQLAQALHETTQHLLQGANIGDVFQAGASDSELAALEHRMGVVLPEDFKQLYRTHNGQTPNQAGCFLAGYEWLDLTGIADRWQGLVDIHTELGLDGANDNDAGIKPVMWSNKWLPFADDNGYLLVLDLDPAAMGAYGQVILLSGDGEPCRLQAASLQAWLDNHVRELQAGYWAYRADYGGVVSVAELAESDAISHEHATQTGRFAPEIMAKLQAEQAGLQQEFQQLLAQAIPADSPFAAFLQSVGSNHFPSMDDVDGCDWQQIEDKIAALNQELQSQGLQDRAAKK